MDSLELLTELIKAEDEKAVDKIISNHSILSKDENWKPYGGFRGNFSQIHNQQGNAIPALVEKPINSIDALLLKHCKLKGIDPESDRAPKSIDEAIEQFYGIKKDLLSELPESKRREVAESIQIIATGSRNQPNVCIYDDGEGQHPTDFENTFLSLNKDNKLKIKFVQGKYNMGSTGAIPNCGEKKYQLIISRKHPQLLNGKEDMYGFALVRLHKAIGVDVYKNSWYEYCVDKDGKIFCFMTKELDVGLFKRKYISGTFIKLFNYDLPRPSDITLDLWRDLNRYLYAPALPILLYEKRFEERGKGRTPTKPMLGNRMRIMIDDRDLKEKTFSLSVNTSGIKSSGEVTVFKNNVDKGEFVDKLAVIFTVNGQVHDHLTNAFITHTAKLPYLSGSLLVNFDCSSIPTSIREEIFMASRDRMRDNTITRNLKEEIARELRDNDFLRQLNERRRDEKIFQNPKDDNFMKRVMGKLLNQNDEIAKILGLKGDIRERIKKMLKTEVKNGVSSFKGSRYPSYVRFKNIGDGNIKMMPQNGECKLVLETDVEDEYLIRSNDAGELKIQFLTSAIRVGGSSIKNHVAPDVDIFDVNVVGPNQGEIKIRIKSKKQLPVGSEIPLDITMTSPSGDIILNAIIKLLNPNEETKQHQIETKDSYSLPKLIEVYREKKEANVNAPCWTDPDYNWTGDDVCKIFPSGEKDHLVDAVAINMDAYVIHDYMRQKKLTDTNIEHLKRLFKVSIYLISLILYFELSQREDVEEKEEMVSFLMKGVGKIALQIVINDEILKEIDKDE
ncbi:MAG: hypothetical protein MUC39_00400 [Candidatus Omnitrophica bacterium]|jgi:hypothetical protein|nr:hypothetical protein [Candidatus Omnitrophota bacterium]